MYPPQSCSRNTVRENNHNLHIQYDDSVSSPPNNNYGNNHERYLKQQTLPSVKMGKQDQTHPASSSVPSDAASKERPRVLSRPVLIK